MDDANPTRPIVNIADVELQPRPPAFAASGDAAQRFDARMGMLMGKSQQKFRQNPRKSWYDLPISMAGSSPPRR